MLCLLQGKIVYVASDMGGSFDPELGLADRFGGFIWHPASSWVYEEAALKRYRKVEFDEIQK